MSTKKVKVARQTHEKSILFIFVNRLLKNKKSNIKSTIPYFNCVEHEMCDGQGEMYYIKIGFGVISKEKYRVYEGELVFPVVKKRKRTSQRKCICRKTKKLATKSLDKYLSKKASFRYNDGIQ